MTELQDSPTASSVDVRANRDVAQRESPDGAPRRQAPNGSAPQQEPEAQHPPETTPSAETAASEEPPRPRRRMSGVVVGACLAGVVLVGYFVWLCVQMGAHAQTGAAPLLAVFASAAVGIGAGGLALALGRKRR